MPSRKKYAAALLVLFLAGAAAQVLPFLLAPTQAELQACFSRLRLPAELSVGYDYEDCAAAERFSRPCLAAGLASNAAQLAVLGLAAFAYAGIAGGFPASSKNKLAAAALFFAALFFVLQLFDAPRSAAFFLHYRAHGLTRLAPAEWFARVRLPNLAIDFVLFVARGLVIFIALNIFKTGWRVACPLLIFLLFNLAPELMPARPIDPGIKVSPLPEGEYRDSIASAAQQAGLKLELLVEDTSSRERTVNMYLGGRSAARCLVLTDTFVEHFTPQEAAVGAAHEMGHLAHDRLFLALRLALKLAVLLAGFQAAFAFAPKPAAPDAALQLKTVLLALFWISVVVTAAMPLQAAVSRRDEELADRKAIEYTRDWPRFGDFLVKGAKLNLERLEHTGFLVAAFSDHPSILERIALAQRWLERLEAQK